MPNVRYSTEPRSPVADRFLADTQLAGKGCPASVLAHRAGLWLVPTRSRSPRGLVGRELHYDERAAEQWREAFITRCVAERVLIYYRQPATPAAISEVTRALLSRQLNA